MTNKTKAAIEEAAKLPTAEETLNTVVGNGCNFRKLFGDNDTDWVIKAIESHTAAHTAALRERARELEEEVKTWRELSELSKKSVRQLIRASERIVVLEAENARYREG